MKISELTKNTPFQFSNDSDNTYKIVKSRKNWKTGKLQYIAEPINGPFYEARKAFVDANKNSGVTMSSGLAWTSGNRNVKPQ